MLHQLALSADAWLDRYADGLVAIHCKGGKGRTGTTSRGRVCH